MSYLFDLYLPLPRQEVIKAVEHRSPMRIPLVQARWWGEGLEEQYGSRLLTLERYPEDAIFLWLELSDYSTWNLPWDIAEQGAHDSRCVLDDWNKLDEFIARMPDPESDPRFDDLKIRVEQARKDNRYVILAW